MEQADRALGLLQDFSGAQIENLTVYDREVGWPAAIADFILVLGLLWEKVSLIDSDALAAVRVAGVSGVTTG